jgi:hypothetical protein
MFSIDRRRFLSNSATLAAVATIPASAFAEPEIVHREAGVKLKLGLNAYSFNKQLREGSMTLMDSVHFCAKQYVRRSPQRLAARPPHRSLWLAQKE